MKLRNLLATTALVLSAPSITWAQDTAQKSDYEGIENIIVTAQHRRENLQKAALAVDVVTQDALSRSGVTSATQLTTMVPALQISQGSGGNQALFIRGVGTLTANSYTDPGVAFNVDGVYIGRPSSMKDIFYDLQRVEVLKGPQGTLYGRNATGGAINVLPNIPKLGELSGSLDAGYGNYNDYHVGGAINLPLGDRVAGRFAFNVNGHDGYLSDGTNDAKSHAMRGQLLAKPSDTVTLRLSGDFSHDGGKGVGSVITAYLNPDLSAVQNPVGRNIGLMDPQSSTIFAHQYAFLAGRFGAGVTDMPHTNNDFWGIKGQADIETSLGTLTAIVSHRGSKLDSIDLGVGFPVSTNQKDHQTSAELRLASPDEGMLRWLLGGYYYDEGINATYQFDLSALTSFQKFSTGTKSEAAFGRLTFAPSDHLRLVGGARFTHDKKRFEGTSNIFLSVCNNIISHVPVCPASPFFPLATSPEQMISQMQLFPVAPGFYLSGLPGAEASGFPRITIPINDTISTNKMTWHAGVEYDVSPNSLLYASYESGYHAGGFAFAQINSSFQPETLDAFTIGSKNRFLDGKLQINLEAFLWKYKDQQVSHFTTDISGALVFVTENVGKSTNKGFEASIKYKATPTTTLNFDAQYLKAKYDNFTYKLPTDFGPPIAGCPMTPVAGGHQVTVNCSGYPAMRSPEWTFNAGIEQIIPLGDYQLLATVDTHYQSRNVIGFEMLSGVSTQNAYWMSNASLTFAPSKGRWSVGAFVNNIENERPVGQSFFNNQFNTFASSPLPPRTYGVRAGVNW